MGTVPADPSQWHKKSQGSVSSNWTTEYVDKPYTCWRCRKAAVFSGEDQKYTYEVKKAPIDQHRILCTDCWRQSLSISKEIEGCEREWASNKVSLSKDKEFLSRWLRLLISTEEYVQYRQNVAAKNMLQKLINALG
jgi:hypothetical protein